MHQELDELFYTHRLMCLKLSFPASILQNSSSTNLRDLPRCFQTSASAAQDLSDHIKAITVNKSTPNSNHKSTRPQVLKSRYSCRSGELISQLDPNLFEKSTSGRREKKTAFSRHNGVPPSRARHLHEQATAPYCEKKKKKKKTTAEKAKHLAASLSATPCHTLVIK